MSHTASTLPAITCLSCGWAPSRTTTFAGLVADAGPAQQNHIFDFSAGESPRLAGTLGVPGGIYDPPSRRFGDLRCNMPSGVGNDANDNIYVAHRGSTGGGSTVLESYTAKGKLNWAVPTIPRRSHWMVMGTSSSPGSPRPIIPPIKYSILLPISLEIHQLDSEVVLTWTDQAFWLQVAPAINGPFIPIPNAESPYTSSIEGVQSFYWLTSD